MSREEASELMRRQQRKEVCPMCRGTGKTFKNVSIYDWGWKICEQCKGEGFIEINIPPPRPRIRQ